ncbi:Oidioi.mRNA.OKI2018_I69.chr2.g4684.t1.cds [Oikopleura dioica]|uniref:Oidioi.mRNA.OKI2018_I69.chr2.g4684.t1.cds n=1 Tax=Oikopleura dioica TaxID=34765 RepID=A0ABN7SY38_OIKDI|nr:Oidioi.mRNA.OKI2018_I69.chr2.g4684.t1.cds [Oikopleura dioica]
MFRSDLCACNDHFGQFVENDLSSSSSSSLDFYDFNELYELDTTSDDHLIQDQHSASIFKEIAIITYISLGVPANLLIIYVSISSLRRNPASNWLIINLCISDLLVLVHSILGLYKEFNRNWRPGSSFTCKYYQGSNQLFLTVSIFSIAAISFDRYYAISGKDGAISLIDFDHKRFIYLTILVWLSAFFITIPTFQAAEYSLNAFNQSECMLNWHHLDKDQCLVLLEGEDTEDCRNLNKCAIKQYRNQKFYDIVFLLLGFCIPLFISGYSYVKILKEVKLTRERISRLSGSNRQGSKNKYLLVTIIASFCGNLISWMCFVLFKLFRVLNIHLSHRDCYFFEKADDILIYTGPILNPILFSFVGKNFRRKFKMKFANLRSQTTRRLPKQDSITQMSFLRSFTGSNESSFRVSRGRKSARRTPSVESTI